MSNNVILWLKGLAAAVVGGAANSMGMMALMPDKFNLGDITALGKLAGCGAVIGLIGYLKQSPLWKEN